MTCSGRTYGTDKKLKYAPKSAAQYTHALATNLPSRCLLCWHYTLMTPYSESDATRRCMLGVQSLSVAVAAGHFIRVRDAHALCEEDEWQRSKFCNYVGNSSLVLQFYDAADGVSVVLSPGGPTGCCLSFRMLEGRNGRPLLGDPLLLIDLSTSISQISATAVPGSTARTALEWPPPAVGESRGAALVGIRCHSHITFLRVECVRQRFDDSSSSSALALDSSMPNARGDWLLDVHVVDTLVFGGDNRPVHIDLRTTSGDRSCAGVLIDAPIVLFNEAGDFHPLIRARAHGVPEYSRVRVPFLASLYGVSNESMQSIMRISHAIPPPHPVIDALSDARGLIVTSRGHCLLWAYMRRPFPNWVNGSAGFDCSVSCLDVAPPHAQQQGNEAAGVHRGGSFAPTAVASVAMQRPRRAHASDLPDLSAGLLRSFLPPVPGPGSFASSILALRFGPAPGQVVLVNSMEVWLGLPHDRNRPNNADHGIRWRCVFRLSGFPVPRACAERLSHTGPDAVSAAVERIHAVAGVEDATLLQLHLHRRVQPQRESPAVSLSAVAAAAASESQSAAAVTSAISEELALAATAAPPAVSAPGPARHQSPSELRLSHILVLSTTTRVIFIDLRDASRPLGSALHPFVSAPPRFMSCVAMPPRSSEAGRTSIGKPTGSTASSSSSEQRAKSSGLSAPASTSTGLSAPASTSTGLSAPASTSTGAGACLGSGSSSITGATIFSEGAPLPGVYSERASLPGVDVAAVSASLARKPGDRAAFTSHQRCWRRWTLTATSPSLCQSVAIEFDVPVVALQSRPSPLAAAWRSYVHPVGGELQLGPVRLVHPPPPSLRSSTRLLGASALPIGPLFPSLPSLHHSSGGSFSRACNASLLLVNPTSDDADPRHGVILRSVPFEGNRYDSSLSAISDAAAVSAAVDRGGECQSIHPCSSEATTRSYLSDISMAAATASAGSARHTSHAAAAGSASVLLPNTFPAGSASVLLPDGRVAIARPPLQHDTRAGARAAAAATHAGARSAAGPVLVDWGAHAVARVLADHALGAYGCAKRKQNIETYKMARRRLRTRGVCGGLSPSVSSTSFSSSTPAAAAAAATSSAAAAGLESGGTSVYESDDDDLPFEFDESCGFSGAVGSLLKSARFTLRPARAVDGAPAPFNLRSSNSAEEGGSGGGGEGAHNSQHARQLQLQRAHHVGEGQLQLQHDHGEDGQLQLQHDHGENGVFASLVHAHGIAVLRRRLKKRGGAPERAPTHSSSSSSSSHADDAHGDTSAAEADGRISSDDDAYPSASSSASADPPVASSSPSLDKQQLEFRPLRIAKSVLVMPNIRIPLVSSARDLLRVEVTPAHAGVNKKHGSAHAVAAREAAAADATAVVAFLGPVEASAAAASPFLPTSSSCASAATAVSGVASGAVAAVAASPTYARDTAMMLDDALLLDSRPPFDALRHLAPSLLLASSILAPTHILDSSLAPTDMRGRVEGDGEDARHNQASPSASASAADAQQRSHRKRCATDTATDADVLALVTAGSLCAAAEEEGGHADGRSHDLEVAAAAERAAAERLLLRADYLDFLTSDRGASPLPRADAFPQSNRRENNNKLGVKHKKVLTVLASHVSSVMTTAAAAAAAVATTVYSASSDAASSSAVASRVLNTRGSFRQQQQQHLSPEVMRLCADVAASAAVAARIEGRHRGDQTLPWLDRDAVVAASHAPPHLLQKSVIAPHIALPVPSTAAAPAATAGIPAAGRSLHRPAPCRATPSSSSASSISAPLSSAAATTAGAPQSAPASARRVRVLSKSGSVAAAAQTAQELAAAAATAAAAAAFAARVRTEVKKSRSSVAVALARVSSPPVGNNNLCARSLSPGMRHLARVIAGRIPLASTQQLPVLPHGDIEATDWSRRSALPCVWSVGALVWSLRGAGRYLRQQQAVEQLQKQRQHYSSSSSLAVSGLDDDSRGHHKAGAHGGGRSRRRLRDVDDVDDNVDEEAMGGGLVLSRRRPRADARHSATSATPLPLLLSPSTIIADRARAPSTSTWNRPPMRCRSAAGARFSASDERNRVLLDLSASARRAVGRSDWRAWSPTAALKHDHRLSSTGASAYAGRAAAAADGSSSAMAPSASSSSALGTRSPASPAPVSGSDRSASILRMLSAWEEGAVNERGALQNHQLTQQQQKQLHRRGTLTDGVSDTAMGKRRRVAPLTDDDDDDADDGNACGSDAIAQCASLSSPLSLNSLSSPLPQSVIDDAVKLLCVPLSLHALTLAVTKQFPALRITYDAVAAAMQADTRVNALIVPIPLPNAPHVRDHISSSSTYENSSSSSSSGGDSASISPVSAHCVCGREASSSTSSTAAYPFSFSSSSSSSSSLSSSSTVPASRRLRARTPCTSRHCMLPFVLVYCAAGRAFDIPRSLGLRSYTSEERGEETTAVPRGTSSSSSQATLSQALRIGKSVTWAESAPSSSSTSATARDARRGVLSSTAENPSWDSPYARPSTASSSSGPSSSGNGGSKASSMMQPVQQFQSGFFTESKLPKRRERHVRPRKGKAAAGTASTAAPSASATAESQGRSAAAAAATEGTATSNSGRGGAHRSDTDSPTFSLSSLSSSDAEADSDAADADADDLEGSQRLHELLGLSQSSSQQQQQQHSQSSQSSSQRVLGATQQSSSTLLQSQTSQWSARNGTGFASDDEEDAATGMLPSASSHAAAAAAAFVASQRHDVCGPHGRPVYASQAQLYERGKKPLSALFSRSAAVTEAAKWRRAMSVRGVTVHEMKRDKLAALSVPSEEEGGEESNASGDDEDGEGEHANVDADESRGVQQSSVKTSSMRQMTALPVQPLSGASLNALLLDWKV